MEARFSEPEAQQLLGIGPAVKQLNESIDQLQVVTVIPPVRVVARQHGHLPTSFALLRRSREVIRPLCAVRSGRVGRTSPVFGRWSYSPALLPGTGNLGVREFLASQTTSEVDSSSIIVICATLP